MLVNSICSVAFFAGCSVLTKQNGFETVDIPFLAFCSGKGKIFCFKVNGILVEILTFLWKKSGILFFKLNNTASGRITLKIKSKITRLTKNMNMRTIFTEIFIWSHRAATRHSKYAINNTEHPRESDSFSVKTFLWKRPNMLGLVEMLLVLLLTNIWTDRYMIPANMIIGMVNPKAMTITFDDEKLCSMSGGSRQTRVSLCLWFMLVESGLM